MIRSIRAIAYYLPQYHPIPENDSWWGKGFTEWTNVAKARRLFPGHYQPHVPADLGFYDLRVPETRIAQAEMARRYGIEGFCYYHYWFGGKQLLERPFSEVLRSGEPDFPFCLCWANQTWTGIWHGAPNRVLIEQRYPGDEDHRRHFDHLCEAFSDHRYITVDGQPMFLVYAPRELPDPKRTTDLWRELAVRAGLKGLFLVGVHNSNWVPQDYGFDAATPLAIGRVQLKPPRLPRRLWMFLLRRLGFPGIYSYSDDVSGFLLPEASRLDMYPCVVPNWDNTPRSGKNGLILLGSTPELFRVHLHATLRQVAQRDAEHRIVFIKSWNEWAEGNHLEPDLRYGCRYLEVVRDEVFGLHNLDTERAED